MSSVVLGIDIGTTSVKVCLIDADTREELSSESKDTQSNIPPTGESAPGAHEQNVRKIVSTLYNCLLWLPKEYLRQVKRIGICGQMHGLVLWRHPAWTDKFELVNENISNLITWQDTRCDHHYLARLPLPDSHLKAYTGYGINTLLWLLDHQPDQDQRIHACSHYPGFHRGNAVRPSSSRHVQSERRILGLFQL
uniref:Sedoheptulokinase n=1 Tax=Cacopsylla melanoneura TaxID=428564 RepID=A0A8D8TX06_9HEMI